MATIKKSLLEHKTTLPQIVDYLRKKRYFKKQINKLRPATVENVLQIANNVIDLPVYLKRCRYLEDLPV